MLRIAQQRVKSRGLLRAIRQNVAHFARIESQQRSGGRGSAKQLAARAGMVSGAHQGHRLDRKQRACADFVTEHHRAQHLLAAQPVALGDGECRRDDAGAGMCARRRMRVIGFVGVTAHTVGERGIDRRSDDAGANYARFARAAERLDVGNRASAGKQPRSRDNRRESIDEVEFGALGNFLRQLALKRCCHVGTELLHQR